MPVSSPARRLWHYATPHRRTIWLASACSILNKIFDLAPPALIGAAVDVVVQREQSLLGRMGVEDPGQQLLVIIAATIVVWGLESAFEYAFAVLWRNLAQSMQHELRLDAYKHLQELGIGWFQDKRRGNLLAILNDDINQLERFLDGGANDILQVATTVVIVGASFFYLSPTMAVFAFLPIPLILWGSFRFQTRIAPRYADVRERNAALNASLENNLAGMEVIKAFASEEREVERIREASDAYRTANRHAIALSSAFSPVIRMAVVLGFIATMLGGGWLALAGTISAGAYGTLAFLVQRLLWPLTRLGSTFDLYQRAMASTDRVLDLLDTEVPIVDGEHGVDRDAVAGELTLSTVGFGYPGREPVFNDFSLNIPAGSTLAVVGATGAGKSTLIRLLLRFFEPQTGAIALDGRDITTLKARELRRAVGFVSQHVVLFPGTVRDNIAYARPDATIDEVIVAARVAEAQGFIEELPDGYDTLLGERGETLSGGQRQRIAIARAVLDNPPILILDEATSAVDNETEAAMQRSLEVVSKDRTTILVAHRLSTVRRADRIVVLDAGAIAESGTHDELVAANGLYARLWDVQTGVA
ncbi:MAG: ABC transporter ATP-binding protein [Proteobacteria bacterium]|nr:ABC transporter ATP-binding protein [Pseudomonadota bacterium]